jgi:ribosomal protein L37AE/L43A
VEKDINLLIDHQCPQCGAPAVLKETDRLFTCEFCRVKSYLLQKDIFRYKFSSPFPKENSLVFFPYWRYKGMLFSCVEDGIKHRFMDVSHQAAESSYFPISVGLRSQALKLSFVTTETQGRFLKPTLSLKEVMHLFENRFGASLPKPVFHQSHLGETLSLIYSPFHIKEKIYDAVLNKPVSPVLTGDFNIDHFASERPNWNIQFIPTLCPGCGWDLHGEQDALVLNCRNCNSVWRPHGNGFKRLKFGCLPKKGDNVIYLPFWRIKADISGISLNSYTDLIKIANLPKAVQNGWDTATFRFWSLAFKVRPQVFIGLTRNITLSQPQKQLLKELPDAKLHPVTLPIEEALESLKVNLASFIKPRKNYFPILQDIKIKPEGYLLVYIPFTEKHHELIQPDLQLAINKNQLRLAANL